MKVKTNQQKYRYENIKLKYYLKKTKFLSNNALKHFEYFKD